MELKTITEDDKEFVMSIDTHVTNDLFKKRVYTKEGYVLWNNLERIGIMNFCILWDNLPFLNFIFVKDEFRGKGFASQAIRAWELDMKKQGYKMTLLSTQVDETAQHLYRKLGYVDCGGLLFNDTPLNQPMEMFFRKVL